MTPEVSVVMGVYNGAQELRRTVESVLAQRGVSLELVAVDDGSTDETLELLREFARLDERVVVMEQQHQGLTAALVLGCAKARGRVIARQDCGDVSMPDRMRRQLEWLDAKPDAVLVSCGTRYIGLFGETVSESVFDSDELTNGLNPATYDALRGPSSHGSVMMRTDAYRTVGGYRRRFVVAQDIDLWLRLAEVGAVGSLHESLYEMHLVPTSITARRRGEQVAHARLAVAAHHARRAGLGEHGVLGDTDATSVRRATRNDRGRAWDRAAFLYFLGRCQRHDNAALAARYYREAVAACPWHWRSLIALMLSRRVPL